MHPTIHFRGRVKVELDQNLSDLTSHLVLERYVTPQQYVRAHIERSTPGSH